MLRRFAFLYKNKIDTGKHWIHIQLDEFLILYMFEFVRFDFYLQLLFKRKQI